MRTGAEIAGLLAEMARLLRARWWLLGFWFCLGWALHDLGLFVAARLGVGHTIAANLCFVVAVVVKLSSLVLMVHCLKPQLRYRNLLGHDSPDREAGFGIPAQVFGTERAVDVAALAVGPFLAVYAVWGFVDDEVRALFVSNYSVLGIGDAQNWSISLDATRLPFYLGFAVAGWLLRQLIAVVQRRHKIVWLGVIGVLAEGIWTFATFVVVIIVLRNYVLFWVRDRLVSVELRAGWQSLLAALPDWKLIFGTRLAELVDDLVTVLPGAAATVLLLPLMWLALTATVYGWREFRARDIVAGTRAARRIESIGARPVGLLSGAALLATADLRTKYLPVVQALRLVLRSGPRFVGAYLLLATCLSSLDQLAQIGLTVLIGPQSLAVSVLIDPLQQLLVGLVITTLSVALYAAGFDRALIDATDRSRDTTAEPGQRSKAITSSPSRREIHTES